MGVEDEVFTEDPMGDLAVELRREDGKDFIDELAVEETPDFPVKIVVAMLVGEPDDEVRVFAFKLDITTEENDADAPGLLDELGYTEEVSANVAEVVDGVVEVVLSTGRVLDQVLRFSTSRLPVTVFGPIYVLWTEPGVLKAWLVDGRTNELDAIVVLDEFTPNAAFIEEIDAVDATGVAEDNEADVVVTAEALVS